MADDFKTHEKFSGGRIYTNSAGREMVKLRVGNTLTFFPVSSMGEEGLLSNQSTMRKALVHIDDLAKKLRSSSN